MLPCRGANLAVDIQLEKHAEARGSTTNQKNGKAERSKSIYIQAALSHW